MGVLGATGRAGKFAFEGVLLQWSKTPIVILPRHQEGTSLDHPKSKLKPFRAYHMFVIFASLASSTLLLRLETVSVQSQFLKTRAAVWHLVDPQGPRRRFRFLSSETVAIACHTIKFTSADVLWPSCGDNSRISEHSWVALRAFVNLH